MRATRRHQKGRISPKIHRGGFGEIKAFEFRKCFKASYDFYYVSRGSDSSYFGFIPTFGLILGLVVGWFFAMFMACFVALIGRILWLVEKGCSRMVSGQNGVYLSCQGVVWHVVA